MSKKEKKMNNPNEPIVLNIPEEEIWTYQVPGLAAPSIGKTPKQYGLKKVLLALVIIVAVSCSCYFSIRTVQKDTLEYETASDGGLMLSKFSNTGFVTELDIDYHQTIEYDSENPDVNTNFKFVKDETQPVTAIREYAFNCDDKLKVINIGPTVTEIEATSFYSCWALERIEVDENNPNYCDIDGVLYNKDVTEIICYPTNHDFYLSNKYGYSQYDENNNWHEPEGEEYDAYKLAVCNYVLPSTVTKIGDLAFNYAFIKELYVPEGLKSIGTLGLFEMTSLEHIYSYKTDKEVLNTAFTSREDLGEVYLSLPEGLEYIGSDAFSYNQSMTYMYIPESVTHIGHHAFWDTCFKQDGELHAITELNVAHDETAFENVETGDQWRPVYEYLLFFKSIPVNYEAERQTLS